MSRLRIGVIGAGNIAQQHLPVLTQHPLCEPVVLCDLDPVTRGETAQRFGIGEQASDPEALLRRDDLDGVFVLVSVLAVAPVAARFLEAGMPTFLEKPPGICSDDTARLAEIAGRRGTLAMVGFNRRFYASHLAARERLQAHGPVVSVTVEAHEDLSRVSRTKFPPSVIRRWAYANGIHALDLLRYFGGEVEEVHSDRERYEGEMPDCQSALLRFTSGARGRALIDWMAPGSHRFEVRCVGARATSAPGFGVTELAVRGEAVTRLEPDAEDRNYKAGFWKQDSAFLEGIRSGRQPPFPAASLPDAYQTMRMIDRICGLPAVEGTG